MTTVWLCVSHARMLCPEERKTRRKRGLSHLFEEFITNRRVGLSAVRTELRSNSAKYDLLFWSFATPRVVGRLGWPSASYYELALTVPKSQDHALSNNQRVISTLRPISLSTIANRTKLGFLRRNIILA